MNIKPIEAIAKAVLYEGYMLYPYRPSSVKNRQRFNFGVLYPRAYAEDQSGCDAWSLQTEVLLEGNPATKIEVNARFLKLVARSTCSNSQDPQARPASWQEAEECCFALPVCELSDLLREPVELSFSLPAKEEIEHSADSATGTDTIVRRHAEIKATLRVKANAAADNIFKLQVQIRNVSEFTPGDAGFDRDASLMRSLVSAHVVLGVERGKFLSLLEPPDEMRGHAADCRNEGVWPVLVGSGGQRDTMLASPIILYDYPQIAPESPGDLFDGTEIDEILALRILTMTDDEKDEMRQTDDRARRMLERTEALPMEQLAKLHGTLRELHPSHEEMP